MICWSNGNYILKTYRQRLGINFASAHSILQIQLFWAGTSSWMGPLNLQWVRKGRKKAESEKGGMRGRGSIGAGLGLNAPLRFGVLMENCGRAGPTAATVAGREARDQTRPWRERKSSEGGRDKQPWGSGTLSDTRPFLSKDLPKLKRKENSE